MSTVLSAGGIYVKSVSPLTLVSVKFDSIYPILQSKAIRQRSRYDRK